MPLKNRAKGQGPRVKEKDDVYVVILIGGKGKRLRPLSTDRRPKAFLSVTADRKTMFRRTICRALHIVGPGQIYVVANKAHRDRIKNNAPSIPARNILLETVSRNTAPAIALAAHEIKKRAGDSIMVVLPTDQYIVEEGRYLSALTQGADFVRDKGDSIAICGQEPAYPATGFGYIKVKDQGDKRDLGVKMVKVEKFVEKPDIDTAKRYVKSGRYLWNMSTFIFRTKTILEKYKTFAPDIYCGTRNIDDVAGYSRLPDISIDYAIMEKTGGIYCLKGDYRWKDMGSFDALRKILKREGRRFTEVGGKITRIL